jgi:hypothetical protein
MLRLLDARVGSPVAVKPARTGLLLVRVHVPGTSDASDLTGLRTLLVGDLLFRAAELDNLQVFAVWGLSGQSPEQMAALRGAAHAFGMHPPADSLGGPADVHLVGEGAEEDAARGGIVVPVARARGQGVVPVGDRYDALAIRFALMSCLYGRPTELTADLMAKAVGTVRHWRGCVAEWAESPSRPMPPQLASVARAAFGDLDTVGLLELLHGLERDDGVPAGAKFETFVYADRILGLDLPREIGSSTGRVSPTPRQPWQ